MSGTPLVIYTSASMNTNILQSGTMRICIGAYAYIKSSCAIAELRKTKVIDSLKDKANEIIIIIIIVKKGILLVNFFANIEAMWKRCSVF